MKTVIMDRDFNFSPDERTTISYKKGSRYERVTEAAVDAITKAGAGKVVSEGRMAAAKEDTSASR